MIAKQSRRQNLLEVCKRYLADAETLIKQSDEENMNGISLQKEKYMLIQEKIKLILHHFKYNVRLRLDDEDFDKIRCQLIQRGLELSSPDILKTMYSIEQNVINNSTSNDASSNSGEGKDKVYHEIWESEIYRLRGKVFMENKQYDEASE